MKFGEVLAYGFLLYIGLLGAEKIKMEYNNRVNIQVPATTKIEQNYVVPSRLEIVCEDLNNNGLCETIIRYDGKNFLFTYDGNNMFGVQYTHNQSDNLKK